MATDLFIDVPESIRLKTPLDLPAPLSEPDLLEEIGRLSQKNKAAASFLGGGSYDHFIPSAVKHLVGRAEFYTAYTPYQPEASQGTLQAVYEYQSLICELTGMDAANASMYDGATALAEAAFMACRITGRKEIVVPTSVHPHYREVLKTYCTAADLTLKEIPYDRKTGLFWNSQTSTPDSRTLTSNSACLLLQQPNFFGNIEDINGLAEKVHAQGALFIVCADPISLGILKAPGDYGADIVVGEGQGLGIPRNFGGPGLGLFATKKEFVRQMPGRIVGRTVDSDGKRGFVLTLSTREQHIRRERATSNICSNEALCALSACIYLSLMGKQGLRKVAELCLQKMAYLKSLIPTNPSLSLLFPSSPSFNETVVRTDKKVGIDLGNYYPDLKGCRLVCTTELTKKSEIDTIFNSTR